MNLLRTGIWIGALAALALAGAADLRGQEESSARRLEYQAPSKVKARMQDFAKSSNQNGMRVETLVIGKTLEGRDILAVEIGAPRPEASAEDMKRGIVRRSARMRPALLIVAGLEADRLIGTTVALDLVDRLLRLPTRAILELLDGVDLYVIPQANPDGAARYFEGIPDPASSAAARARAAHAGNARLIDWDRDAREGAEDIPVDLNADGLITMMRYRDEEGAWIVDPDDSRIMRLADAEKGENGNYRHVIESRDRDGDGDYGENPSWGVNLDRNFPRDFKENDLESGLHMVSEPETKALIDYVLARRNIALTICYGGHDNLAEIPKAAKKPSGSGFRRSRATGLWEEDRKVLEELREVREESDAGFGVSARDEKGGFAAWSYYQFGAFSLALNLFQVDDKAEKKKEEGEKQSKSAEGEKKEEEKPDSKKEPEDPVKAHLAERRLSAFLPWKELDHPQLGKVEVGGWKPFMRENPSEEIAAVLARREFDFLKKVLPRFAKLQVDRPVVKRLASGLFEMKLRVHNSGLMPTASRQGSYNREVGPVMVEIDLPKERFVQGDARGRVDSLAAKNGEFHRRWVMRGKSGESVFIRVAEAKSHPILMEVVLP